MDVVPDVNTLSPSEKLRKYSIGKSLVLDPDEIEKITVQPSTELIPDEYEHEDNNKGLVLIFYSKKDVDNMKLMREALSDQKYDISDSNVFKMPSKDTVLNNLREVAQTNHEDKTCFILIFIGTATDEIGDRFLLDDEDKKNCIMIREVWSLFTSDNCPSLRYKPKIFIFQASTKFESVQHDGIRMQRDVSVHGEYDIPAEADILLVYKKIEDPMDRNHFIEQLCNNIDDDGDKDDVIGIVTRTEHKREKRPLIISTLTRKFYVRASNKRGHHQDLHQNHGTVIEILQDLQRKIDSIQEQQSSFKRKLEQRVGRKWLDTTPGTSSNITQVEDSIIKRRESPKLEQSFITKKISRPPSSASSVDSKSTSKKSAKKPWKY